MESFGAIAARAKRARQAKAQMGTLHEASSCAAHLADAGDGSLRGRKRTHAEVEQSSIPASVPPRSPSPMQLRETGGGSPPPASPPNQSLAAAAEAHAREAVERERVEREEQEDLDRHHRQNVAQCNLPPPRVTSRPDRRTLPLETPSRVPVFLEPGPMRERATIPGSNRQLRAEEVSIRPGVLTTDTVADPGIGPRLIYSSILPLDEHRFIAPTRRMMDSANQMMIEV